MSGVERSLGKRIKLCDALRFGNGGDDDDGDDGVCVSIHARLCGGGWSVSVCACTCSYMELLYVVAGGHHSG